MQSHEERKAKIFEHFLSEGVLRKLENTEVPQLAEATIDFVLVKVRESPWEDFQKCLDAVINIALDNQAIVEVIMSSLVLITYGATDFCPPSTEKRKCLVTELMEQQRENIAIIEGRQQTLAGTYGNSVRAAFGSIIRGILGLLKELESLNYGASKEMPQNYNQ